MVLEIFLAGNGAHINIYQPHIYLCLKRRQTIQEKRNMNQTCSEWIRMNEWNMNQIQLAQLSVHTLMVPILIRCLYGPQCFYPRKGKAEQSILFRPVFFFAFLYTIASLSSFNLAMHFMASVKLECGRDEIKRADERVSAITVFFSCHEIFTKEVCDQVAYAVHFGNWTVCTLVKRRVSCNRRQRRSRQTLRTQKIPVSYR